MSTKQIDDIGIGFRGLRKQDGIPDMSSRFLQPSTKSHTTLNYIDKTKVLDIQVWVRAVYYYHINNKLEMDATL